MTPKTFNERLRHPKDRILCLHREHATVQAGVNDVANGSNKPRIQRIGSVNLIRCEIAKFVTAPGKCRGD